jgi:PAS domain S-box-containing protein
MPAMIPADDDFRRLLDALTYCVLLHDAKTKAIVWANRAACDVLGFTLEELLPLKAHDMTRPAPQYRREVGVSAMDRSITEGPQVYEWCYRSRDGVDMLSEAIATYVPLPGRPVVMVQFRDISAEDAMRRELRLYEARLEHAGRYNAMGEMATAIAHELSQPLAAVRNFIEGAIKRLQQPGNVDDAVWGLHNANRQAEHAAHIIKSVREYIVRREPIDVRADLRDVLSDVAYFIELRAQEAGVTLSIEQAEEALPVVCERVLVGQVILNLAFNAIEALSTMERSGRRLGLVTASDGKLARVQVIDSGPGVPEGAHARLFDGFSSSKVGGNGIGLTLCKNIVTRHGGTIEAVPVEPSGLDCRFSLPLA